MAYFCNGTEGMRYEADFCERCVHYDGEEGCPVMAIHMLYNYDQIDNKDLKTILELLIPTDGDGFAGECKLFYKITDDEASKLDKDQGDLFEQPNSTEGATSQEVPGKVNP